MIAVIVGTNRPNSNSRRVADQVVRMHFTLGCPSHLIDLANLPPGIIHPTAYDEKPPEFSEFSSKVLDATGLVVVVPEYNGSFPGVLKLFIDHLPFPQSLERKPVCLVGISAGMWGALRAVEQLQGIFGYRNAHLFPERVFIPRCNSVFDSEGRMNDIDLLGRLERQAMGFCKFIEVLSRTPAVA